MASLIFLTQVPFQQLTSGQVSAFWCYSFVFLFQVSVILCRNVFTAPPFHMNYNVVKTLQKKLFSIVWGCWFQARQLEWDKIMAYSVIWEKAQILNHCLGIFLFCFVLRFYRTIVSLWVAIETMSVFLSVVHLVKLILFFSCIHWIYFIII